MTLKATRRALYKYVCRNCNKKRYSFLYDRAGQDQICRKCRREMPAANQPALFATMGVENPDTPIIQDAAFVEKAIQENKN